jgi:Ribosomal protein L11 methyltransferase (PrmA)
MLAIYRHEPRLLQLNTEFERLTGWTTEGASQVDGDLGELLEPGGVLILSGIIDKQAAEVESALSRHGLKLIDVLNQM